MNRRSFLQSLALTAAGLYVPKTVYFDMGKNIRWREVAIMLQGNCDEWRARGADGFCLFTHYLVPYVNGKVGRPDQVEILAGDPVDTRIIESYLPNVAINSAEHDTVAGNLNEAPNVPVSIVNRWYPPHLLRGRSFYTPA